MSDDNNVASTKFVSVLNLEFSPSCSYLVKGWFGKGQTSLVFGPSNVGKSFFAFDLAYHVALGQEWYGARVREGRVLYIATEGQSGQRPRVEALRKYKGFPPGFDEFRWLFYPGIVNLHNPEVADKLAKIIEDEEFQLIIVDTLAMALGEGSENDNTTITAFLSSLSKLRAVSKDVHIMLIHHTGKDKGRGARGHSSLRAAVDTEVFLDRSGQSITVTPTKQRDLAAAKSLSLMLKTVDVGVDDDGDTVTSCVLQEAAASALISFQKPLSDKEQQVLDCLVQAIEDHGVPHPEPALVPERVVNMECWKRECRHLELSQGQSKDANRKALGRARDALIESGHVREEHDLVWVPLSLMGDEDVFVDDDVDD